AMMHSHGGAMFDRSRLCGQTRGAREHYVHNRARLSEVRRRNDVAPPSTGSIPLSRHGHIRQTQGRACAGTDLLDFPIMILNRADSRWNLRGLDDHGLSAPERSTHEGAGHDSSDAAQYKCAIDGEPRFTEVALRNEG